MKKFKWYFVFVGALAYGWMLGILTKNGMPDIMALVGSLIAPIGVGFALGRPLAKAYTVAGDNTDEKKELINIIACTFFLLSLGVTIGNTLGIVAQKNSWLGNDKKKEVELWREILTDPADNGKVGSMLFDKYYGKPVTGNSSEISRDLLKKSTGQAQVTIDTTQNVK